MSIGRWAMPTLQLLSLPTSFQPTSAILRRGAWCRLAVGEPSFGFKYFVRLPPTQRSARALRRCEDAARIASGAT